MSWRAINIDYPHHAEVNSVIVFLPNWVIFIILRLKAPKFGKSQFAMVWCSEVLQHCTQWTNYKAGDKQTQKLNWVVYNVGSYGEIEHSSSDHAHIAWFNWF